MERCLEAAATEIDWELGYTEADPGPRPAASTGRRGQPRAGRRTLAAVLSARSGLSAVGAESEPIVAARNSWYRHRSETRPAQGARGHCVTLAETMEDIADALAPVAAEVDGLQVYPFLNSNPTPPALDIYPGAPFQTGAGFGVGQSQVWFTIRARVRTADQESAMRLLLRMMDPNDPAIGRGRDRGHRSGHPGRRVASSASTSRTPPRTGACSAVNGG